MLQAKKHKQSQVCVDSFSQQYYFVEESVDKRSQELVHVNENNPKTFDSCILRHYLTRELEC